MLGGSERDVLLKERLDASFKTKNVKRFINNVHAFVNQCTCYILERYIIQKTNHIH